jgi:hypothetical protein
MAVVDILEGVGELGAHYWKTAVSYLTVLAYNAARSVRKVGLFRQANGARIQRRTRTACCRLPRTAPDVGINAKRNSRVRLAVGNVRWVKY